MSKAQHKRQNQIKTARLEIVSQLYKRGYSIRAIRAEVMCRLDLATYSTQTVHRDVQALLKEWRESRLENIDDALQLELSRIDDAERELWEQWEKSKEDYTKKQRKRKGRPARDAQEDNGGGEGIRTFSIEEQSQDIIGLGDPRYIAEIRQQQSERRKLLGLYKTQVDVTGTLGGEIEIRCVRTGYAPATSEEEVRARDGIKDDTV